MVNVSGLLSEGGSVGYLGMKLSTYDTGFLVAWRHVL
jgi:hypothetical protein